MRSTTTPVDGSGTAARIRDAAIWCFAEEGLDAGVRAIAERAGVSPGLVIHHFGSKDGLRSACDAHLLRLIREGKSAAMEAGPGLDPLAALRQTGQDLPIMKYLSRVLVDRSPAVAELVDGLVDDAAGYMQRGVETGMLRPTDLPRERAAVLTLWSLGMLALHDHLHRILGVDLVSGDPGDPANTGPYFAAAAEIFASGLLTEAFAQNLRDALAGDTGGEENDR